MSLIWRRRGCSGVRAAGCLYSSPLMFCSFRLAARRVRLGGHLHGAALSLSTCCFCAWPRFCRPSGVLLLWPCLSAGPVAVLSVLSCSVAQHLLFCSEPRLCRLTGEDGLLKLLGVDSGPLCYAPFASPLGWSGCGVVCIEPLCRSASVICTSPRLCRPYGHDGLLEPRPSALSRSVALPLFFSA